MSAVSAGRGALIIQTPEGISFPLLLAGPFTRCLAWAVDMACIMAIAGAADIIFVLLGIISRDLAMAAGTAGSIIISIGYGILLEWKMRGQTMGKRLFSLRVMDAQGLHLKLNQIVMRNILRFVDILPGLYLAGGICSLVTPKAQRLGDLAAGTIVVYQPKIQEPDLDQLLADKYNSLRDYPHLEARLRQRVTPEEAGVALAALLRRDSLAPQARVALFRDLASRFQAMVEFPQQALEGISDERYVRNVVDVIFR